MNSTLTAIIDEAVDMEDEQILEVLAIATDMNRKKGIPLMKLELKSPFGTTSFDMTEIHVLEMLQRAIQYHVSDTLPLPAPVSVVQTAQPEMPVASVEPTEPAESMSDLLGDDKPEPTYSGFLYVRCSRCGKEKGYCAKIPTNRHKCECGATTKLKDLRFVNAICKCGGVFTYKTNISDETFSISCMKCGAPIDLIKNRWGASYRTLVDNIDES